MLRIIHLSDIHLNQATQKDAESFIFKALQDDIIQFNNKKPIDILAISGDLIDRGGKSFENDPQLAFMTFEDIFIDKIVKSINLPKHRIFFAGVDPKA